jgi:peptide/nickel transport system substrate-binding protein
MCLTKKGVILLVCCVWLCSPSIGFSSPQKIVTVAVGEDITTLDPHKISSGGDFQFFNHVFEGLYGHDIEGKLVPRLALSHSISSDKKEYTFKLRSDVKFHNGKTFTAEDVRYSWQRSNDPNIKNPRAGVVTRNIADVEIIDDLTVRLILKSPDPAILENMGENFLIVSKQTRQKEQSEGASFTPIGTGPYKFVSRRVKEQMQLASFSQYWGNKPNIDQLLMKIVTDPLTRIAMLKVGEVDAITKVQPHSVKELEKDKNVKLIFIPTYGNRFIVLNTRAPHGQFADPKVRRALNMAVDRETIVDRVMFGFATPSAALCNVSIIGCDIGRDPYPYDPKKARKLLEEANFDFSRTYKFVGLAPGRISQSKEVSEAVALYLNEVGVKIDLQILEFGSFMATTAAREYDKIDMFFQGWPDYTNDPISRLRRSWQTDGALSYHSDPVLDAMIDEAGSIVEPKARESHMKEIFTYAYENPSEIILFTSIEIFAVRKNIHWKPRKNVIWPVFYVIDKE